MFKNKLLLILAFNPFVFCFLYLYTPSSFDLILAIVQYMYYQKCNYLLHNMKIHFH